MSVYCNLIALVEFPLLNYVDVVKIVKNKLSRLFTRLKEIYRQEGLVTLFRRIPAFLLYSLGFEYDSYYVIERMLEHRNEAYFLPKIKNFTYKIVETTQQLDELIKDDEEKEDG